MQLILAVVLPGLFFFTIGRPYAGTACLLLQLTLFGWFPAALWALYALSHHLTHKRVSRGIVRGS